MFQHNTYKRVTYRETDRMGFLYYGNYAEYYEIGRVESFRKLGIRYLEMEEKERVALPVIHMETRYLRPATYDELIRIETTLESMPEQNVIAISRLYNEQDKLINEGIVTLTFMSMDTMKRCPIPTSLKEKLLPFFAKTP